MLFIYKTTILFVFFVSMSDEIIVSQTKLFVGGLNRQMRGNDLREEFSKFGEIVFARVNLDKETKRSKGFGFVEFANPEDAAKAKADMDGQEVWGRPIKVDFAKEDPTKMFTRTESTAPEASAEVAEEEAEVGADDETVVDENAF